jgi:hypothetical protein
VKKSFSDEGAMVDAQWAIANGATANSKDKVKLFRYVI